MTQKSGQKCTAIRRVLVPAGAVRRRGRSDRRASWPTITVGNPRNESVRMGSLVSRAQLDAVRDGLAELRAQAERAARRRRARAGRCRSRGRRLRRPDAARRARCRTRPQRVHDVEVFGPVATLMPYRDRRPGVRAGAPRPGLAGDFALRQRSARAGARPRSQLADSHGRVHVISPDVAQAHTGHGNVMPQSLHGGPGRAGGGEELGGLRALDFYHRRAAVQAEPRPSLSAR